MQKKRTFTLLEIMIVIFLIGLIGSIVGYSMKGSLEQGKAFKTEQAIARVIDLLELVQARGSTNQEINDDCQTLLADLGVVKNVENLLTDGWGNPLKVHVNVDGQVNVSSNALDNFNAKKKQKSAKKV